MAAEAIVLLGATDYYGRAFEALDAWTQATQATPFALLAATLGLDVDGNWLRQALPPVAQRLRDAVERSADEPAAAGAYASDVEGWLQLTGYASDAVAKARALRCRAVGALTAAGETLGTGQVLVTVEPLDLARLREMQGRLADAAETFEAADVPANALRNWRAERLVQLLEASSGSSRSGRTATAATALPLVILPALGPGCRPASSRPTACPRSRTRREPGASSAAG